MSYSNQYSYGARHLNKRRSKWMRVFIITAIVLLLAATFFVVREVKRNPIWMQTLTNYRESVTAWVSLRKQRLHQTVANVRKESKNRDDDERVVKFEFYNTLQDMQSMQVQAQAAATKKQEQKTLEKLNANQIAATATSAKIKKPVKIITQAADLENDLLAVMKQQSKGN